MKPITATDVKEREQAVHALAPDGLFSLPAGHHKRVCKQGNNCPICEFINKKLWPWYFQAALARMEEWAND